MPGSPRRSRLGKCAMREAVRRPPKGRTRGLRGRTPLVTATGGKNKRVSPAALIAVKAGQRPRTAGPPRVTGVHHGRDLAQLRHQDRRCPSITTTVRGLAAATVGISSTPVMRMAHTNLPLVGREVQKPKPNQVPSTPRSAGPSTTPSDSASALTCGNRTQHDCLRRIRHGWRAEVPPAGRVRGRTSRPTDGCGRRDEAAARSFIRVRSAVHLRSRCRRCTLHCPKYQRRTRTGAAISRRGTR